MKKTCVIGWPIKHSRSPLIHNYWLKRYGIESIYEKQAVDPKELPNFITNLALSSYLGCNVTIPHKEQVLGLVDVADDISQRLKAVNTLYYRDGKLHGTNTDGEGFIASLKAALPNIDLTQKNITLIGAGGAAKAIIGALLDNNVAQIGIINRTANRTDELRQNFGNKIISITADQQNQALHNCHLLVNTTSLGMEGQPALEFDFTPLNPRAAVADIVYTPLKTGFLQKAEENGHPIIEGLGMLLHQAKRGFFLWYGVEPEITEELCALLRHDIEKSKV